MSNNNKTADTGPVVVLENVKRSFGNKPVLSKINLAVSHGEMVGIVGPNGGGKSTLLFLMAGLLKPDFGKVVVNGTDAHSLSLSSAGSVGLVTARPGLYPLLTGRENLWHFGGLFGLLQSEVDEKAEPLIKDFELFKNTDMRVDQMSTGMRQKVSLIRALLLSPVLLLLDEPTANLDPIVATLFYKEMRRRTDDGQACVLVTHDLSAAECICDRVLIVNGTIKKEIVLNKKRYVASGPIYTAWMEEA